MFAALVCMMLLALLVSASAAALPLPEPEDTEVLVGGVGAQVGLVTLGTSVGLHGRLEYGSFRGPRMIAELGGLYTLSGLGSPRAGITYSLAVPVYFGRSPTWGWGFLPRLTGYNFTENNYLLRSLSADLMGSFEWRPNRALRLSVDAGLQVIEADGQFVGVGYPAAQVALHHGSGLFLICNLSLFRAAGLVGFEWAAR